MALMMGWISPVVKEAYWVPAVVHKSCLVALEIAGEFAI